ncbi:MAG TPA: glycogen debranching N-terminal domain-containing protein [Acidimicrobiales bacterium]|nr:glycogen debranching N-terminal domain-containing protein [Acidimicrobiales bacterium]
MSADWSFADPQNHSGAQGGFVLVEGDSFCISADNGDVRPGSIEGLFDRDTRFLSQWELMVGDAPLEQLAALPSTPFSGGVLGRARPVAGRADSTLLVRRHRYVGRGMREDIVLHNWAREPVALTCGCREPHPPSSSDYSVLVDEAPQTIGSS